MPRTTRETAEALVRSLEARAAAAADPEKLSAALGDLYAEDTVVEHVFGVPRTRIEGLDQLREHFSRAPLHRFDVTVRDVRIDVSADDPEVVTVRYDYEGRIRDNGRPLRVPNILVLRVRDGLIAESADYHHHGALAAALDHVDGYTQRLTEEFGA